MATNLIEYIIKHTDLKQKDIASKLDVSPTQITKWKKGEKIPYEKEEQLKKIANLFTDDIAWAEIAINKENAARWYKYIYELNEMVEIPANDLRDDPEINGSSVLKALRNAGIPIPKSPPPFDEENDTLPFNQLILELLNNYGRYYQWCEQNLFNIDHNGIRDEVWEADYFSMGMSIGYLEDESLLNAGADLKQIKGYVTKIKFEAIDFIRSICTLMEKSGVHMNQDLYVFVNESPYALEDNMMFASLEGNIESHLSFGEKIILQEVRELKALVMDLMSSQANTKH